MIRAIYFAIPIDKKHFLFLKIIMIRETKK